MTIEASPLAETITRLFKDKVSTLEIEAICAGIWRSRILADRLSSLEDRHISLVRTSVLKATMVRGTRALLIDRADLISEEHQPEINVSRRV